MKKNDLILIIIMFAIALGGYGVIRWTSSEDPSMVKVMVDTKEYGTYDLNKNQTIQINDTNTLEIKAGIADMVEATCPDKLCVNQKEISGDREQIVCLPNKVIVEITSDRENDLDAVAN